MRAGPRLLAATLFGAVGLFAACLDSTDVELVEIDATGILTGLAFLDNNGNGLLDGNDEPIQEARIELTAGQGGQVVQQAETDTAGIYRMPDVPVGRYQLGLERALLGDTLVAVAVGVETVEVKRDVETQVNLGVSFPVLTVEEVRAAVPGRRVFTTGIALNPRQSFGDGLVHLKGDSAFLRATNVARANLGTGDSVRFLGRTKVDNGQPVLDDVTPTVLISLATIPVAVEASTGAAANAAGGPLDAGLVRVRDANISDTLTLDGNFHFKLDDGSGPVEVVLRSFLQLESSGIRPDTVLWAREATGLLVPRVDETGTTRWRLLPRGGSDVRFENKLVDVSVVVTADTLRASTGDTITLTVVARNVGPRPATGVAIVDTIPEGLALVGSSATRGSYDPGTHRWPLDTLKAALADTLTLRVRVTATQPGSIENRAWAPPLRYEFDTDPFNNLGAVTIQVGGLSASQAMRVEEPLWWAPRRAVPAPAVRRAQNE